ncbi:MAG: hypothetical protein K2G69_04705, partial [Muribaculaceae bacterium]|nr:hypothetical protein [Muribaculaceae bacterium]
GEAAVPVRAMAAKRSDEKSFFMIRWIFYRINGIIGRIFSHSISSLKCIAPYISSMDIRNDFSGWSFKLDKNLGNSNHYH